MHKRLKGRVAVITGASSGIGAATARLFVAEGCKVVLGDIQSDRGQVLAVELGSAVFSLCDITKEKDISNLIDLAVSEYGQIDIRFNCAGMVGKCGRAPQRCVLRHETCRKIYETAPLRHNY